MRKLATAAAAFAALVLSATPGLADAGFQRWVQGFWPQAKAAGISRATFDQAFAGIDVDAEVLEKARYQPEFVKPIWEYVDSAASAKRVENGRRMLAERRAELDAIEAKYGVDRHVLVAIWGMESSYGAVLDNAKIVKPVIQSLATLAYRDKRRARFARQQLIAALKILQRGDVGTAGLTGSWAGAMGHTQFIPTTYNGYAVDFDGDGRRNIWTSPPDALASAANYLKKSGWVAGKTWGYEVELPRGFDYSMGNEKTVLAVSDWQRMGVRRAGGRDFPRPSDQARLLLPAGARGPAFLMLKNHYVIKRYNNATAYALAIGHLSDLLRGGEAFAQSWPRDTRPLTRAEAKALQGELARLGFYSGTIDGKIGAGSQAAIRAYQARIGMEPDGFADLGLLERLRNS